MSFELRLREPLGERRFTPRDLPLDVGGEGTALAVPGVAEHTVAARLDADEHGLLLDSIPDIEPPLKLNGIAVHERARLSQGDVITVGDARLVCRFDGAAPLLEVVHLEGNATVAPLVDPGEREDEVDVGPEVRAIRGVNFRPVIGARSTETRERNPWRWAVAAVLAVLAFMLWFFIAANTVRVVAEPRTAQVSFAGGWPRLAVGDVVLLRSGKYQITATNPGYQTAHEQVEITSQPNQRVTITLAKLPGKVHVDTGAVAGTLSVDGKALGAVPGEYDVPAGAHQFAIAAARYLPFSEQVEVKGLGEKQEYKPKLKPAFSPVTIESKPTGARVSVDGRDVGATPLTTDIDAGNYVLALVAPGFRRWESSIQVQADTPLRIGPVELGLPDGHLVVRSSPAQADVSIAGRYRGRTPFEVDLAPGVQYSVVINHAGYEPANHAVLIKAGERAPLEVKLKPILGEVTVRGEPADAQLVVEGEAKGSANQTLSLPSTELKVEIRRDGYQPFTTTVTPQPGFPRVVEYKLLTPEQARAARVPSVIKTHAGAELRLMPIGQFAMGSPRREPGRRANETQRQITLTRPFYLGAREVTNGEFREFKPDHLSGVVRDRSLDQDSHPVVNITWRDAAEFCNWLSQREGLPPAYVADGDQLVPATPLTTGYRLPTEAEWEWAARYQGGQATRRYPWGNSLPVAPKSGNYADKSSLVLLEAALEGYDDSVPLTAPVGQFPPNPLGLYDMGGNVSEWIQDFYTVYPELEGGPTTDPLGPKTGSRHVVRGSNWKTSSVMELRLAWRDYAEGKAQTIGFRLARYAE